MKLIMRRALLMWKKHQIQGQHWVHERNRVRQEHNHNAQLENLAPLVLVSKETEDNTESTGEWGFWTIFLGRLRNRQAVLHDFRGSMKPRFQFDME